MNLWFRISDIAWSVAIPVFAGVTVVLLAALVVHEMLRRSPVGRHAVWLWALVAVGLCPIMTIAIRLAAIARPLAIRNPIAPLEVLFGHAETVGRLRDSRLTATDHFSIAAILLALWAAGTLMGLARVIRGFHAMRRIQRAAIPAPEERIAPVRERLSRMLGRKVPQIFASEQVGVPSVIGCLQPIVLLPSSLLAHLHDEQLFQVLVHECAHAFRRDALVGLYQRILTAFFWFHPLVHFANRMLDQAREEVCDNHVLRTVSAADYARTLLTVAQSLSPLPDEWFAPTLVQTASSLENRVAGLLNPRRRIMTGLTPRKATAMAVCFIASTLVLSCFAGTPATPQDPSSELSRVVRLGSSSHDGDSISISEVRGTSETISAGNTYEVKGTYKLASRDKALLAISVTTETDEAHPVVHHPADPAQKTIVEKGEGRFTLRFHLWDEGNAHVSFYPVRDGSSFVSVYF